MHTIITSVTGVVFSGFKSYCSNRRDSMIAPGDSNEDVNHPMKMWNITVLDSERESYVFYPRASLG